MPRIIKLMLFMFVGFTTISCTSDNTVVSYKIKNSVRKVTDKQVLSFMQEFYGQISPQEISLFLTNQEILKIVILGQLVEPKILTIEALKISNFTKDPEYLAMLDNQKTRLAYQIAYQKGLERVQKDIANIPIEIAEVSQILFTNTNTSQGMTIDEILNALAISEDLNADFVEYAMQYSQEDLGAQNGGYLGVVKKGRFAHLEEVVFDENFEGLYPDILVNDDGSYIVLVHTKNHTVKLKDLETRNLGELAANEDINYISRNIEYLFTLDENNNLYLGDQLIEDPNTLSDKTVILKIWGKPYTLGSLRKVVAVVTGELGFAQGTTLPLLAGLKNFEPGTDISPLGYQSALISYGNSPFIKNSKEFKTTLNKNKEALELDYVYQIMSGMISSQISTNVTDEELQAYYAIPENRFTVAGEPIVGSLAANKQVLTDVILARRAGVFQNAFRESLVETYAITWNEENLKTLMQQLNDSYQEFMMNIGN